MNFSFGERRKSGSRSRIGQKNPREGRNGKPTDNKQHNSDLKGDFQADSHGNLSRAVENEKKRPKGMLFRENNSSGSGSHKLNNI